MMLQTLSVALIVLTASLYSGWSLMPAPVRRRAAARVAAQLRRLGADARRTERLQAALATSGGCSDCSSCKGCDTPAAPQRADGLAVVTVRRARRPNT